MALGIGIPFFGIAFGLISDDFSTAALVLTLVFFVILAAIIAWLWGTAKAVKEIYVVTKAALIDLFTIKREIKVRCPNALKAEILEKSKNAVNVGIFDQNDEMTTKMNIIGEGVVSDDIYVGKVIMMN